MPSEFRQVRFTNKELIEALCEYNDAAQTKLPGGNIVSCTPVTEATVAVRLELSDQESGETQVVSLAPELVAAALLRYCNRQGIPMPKNAGKSIQVHGDEISLNVHIEGRTKRREPAPFAEGDETPSL